VITAERFLLRWNFDLSEKSGVSRSAQTWPVLLIVIGICTLIQKFRDLGGWIITLPGRGFSFMSSTDSMFPSIRICVAGIIILLGIFVLLRRKKG
jgi:hypothetical protein